METIWTKSLKFKLPSEDVSGCVLTPGLHQMSLSVCASSQLRSIFAKCRSSNPALNRLRGTGSWAQKQKKAHCLFYIKLKKFKIKIN